MTTALTGSGTLNQPSILFVTTVPITLEVFLAPFAKYFRTRGWRVDALANGASKNPAISSAFDERFDVRWSRSPVDPRNLVGSASAVRRIVREGRYDIVHVHTPIAAFVTRWALRRARCQGGPVVIYTAHGFYFYRGQSALPNALFHTMERMASHWTDYLVTINEEDRAAARALGGMPPERVRLIPGIGVDVDRYGDGVVSAYEKTAVRAGLDVGDDRVMLTMIAEFAPVKRHEHVLRAFAGMKSDTAVLVLVGDGPLEPAVRRQVADLGLEARVRFAGYRRDIAAVLAASDALVIASEREGLNRSALEAMASARPVIGTATRGIADLITPETGWLADKYDVRSLADAMDAATADADERIRRGAAARERALHEFALPHIIREYEELYREALASRV